MKITLAATQMACSKIYDENIKKATQIIEKAKKKGADVILLQELFERNYFCQVEDYERFDFAEEYEHSKTLDYFSKVAKDNQVVLPISFFEKAGNCYFNSLCVIDSDGSRLGLYRKTHIPTGSCYEEKFYFTPGDTGFKVFDTHFGRLGVAICWDQWFCETGRILALKGAQYMLFPTAIGSEPILPLDSEPHWHNAMVGQSALNIMPVVASNRIGTEKEKGSEMTFFGSSFITDETGCVVAQASRDKEEILTHAFDLDEIDRKRRDWGIFRDRRTDMYADILKNDDSKR
ncbi:MAG: N-carbamoylputrescine amidase [Bacilli bacterium]|jgi:N-carbamoylputrescine amidase